MEANEARKRGLSRGELGIAKGSRRRGGHSSSFGKGTRAFLSFFALRRTLPKVSFSAQRKEGDKLLLHLRVLYFLLAAMDDE